MKKIKFLFQRIKSMNYKAMFEAIDEVHKRSGKNKVLIFLDMVYCGFKYQAGYSDYLDFEFYNKNRKIRANYVTRGISNAYVKKMNYDKEMWKLIDDKNSFLKNFSHLHHRDWLDLSVHNEDDLKAFIEKHDKFIVKPIDGICGKGIEVYNSDEIASVENLYQILKENGQWVVEEYITQHKALSKLYPHSVNTIRIVTLKNSEGVHIPFAGIRMGNGKQIDNLNNGGIAAKIDVDAGVICSNGAAKYGQRMTVHPMTNVQFKGYEIPHFEQAKAAVIKAAEDIEGLNYLAWDVAILPDGVTIIEANPFPGHDIIQLPGYSEDLDTGMKDVFDKIIYE